jgi:lipopolysaccharide/colanic/teichoic acid biosynthesis glycosyltransferase
MATARTLRRTRCQNAETHSKMITKRVIDIAVAGIGLIVISPVLVGIALCIRLKEGSPILYAATRVGQNGHLFSLYKFRSMIPSQGSSVTVWADPRVTPSGRVLRRLKLDELPQLFNVLRGDMSLVGPRPEDPSYVSLYTPEQRKILRLKPGITSAAALEYWDEDSLLKGEDWEQAYRERIMPAKLQLEAEYSARRSLRSDAQIFVRTVLMLMGRLAGTR